MARLLVAFCLLLTVLAPAVAQDAAPPSAGQNERRPPGGGGVAPPFGPAGPRFKVELTNFQVIDESGWDFLGSDEAVFIVRTQSYKVFTREFGNLDSDGTVHDFDRDARCIAPVVDTGLPDGRWSCDQRGIVAPISFRLEAWEQDARLLSFCSVQHAGTDARHPDLGICADSYPAWIIGEASIRLELPDLLARLPRIGQSFNRNVLLQGGCFTQICDRDDIEPRYNVIYTVTRLPDALGSGGVVVDR